MDHALLAKNNTGKAWFITKTYLLVFVCFSTKAIHLEPTSDLTSQIQSDNGKTFVGKKESVTVAYSHQQLNGQFPFPGAPHMEGLW